MSSKWAIVLAVATVSLAVGCVVLAEKPKVKTEIKEEGDCKLDWVWSMYTKGSNLFVVSHRDGNINVFAMDQKSGDVKFQGFMDLNKDVGGESHLDAYLVLSDKNILYATGAWTHHKREDPKSIGLTWYKFDPASGKGVKLGNKSCDSSTIHQSPADPGTLYLAAFYADNIQTVKLDASGAPNIGAKTTGKGLGLGLAFSTDGKNAYSMSNGAVGWVNIGTGGALSYGGSVEIESPSKLQFSAIAVSPDGKNVYAAQSSKGSGGKLWAFTRDAATGKLQALETYTDSGYDGMTQLLFSPDGKDGYFSVGPEKSSSGLGYLARDPASGKLAYGGKADHKGGAYGLAYVPQSGTIYLGGFFSPPKSFKVFSVTPQAVPAAKGK